MKRLAGAVILVFVCGSLVPTAQQPATPTPSQPGQGGRGRGGAAGEPETIPLWDADTPGAHGAADADRPTLTMYQAAGRGGPRTAVIIAPGGAYAGLSMNLEGREWAYWFNAMGVTAFVLKYRLGPAYHHPIQLGDAQRAVRLARVRAATSGYDVDRIGFMGFSAGGHLAATVATHNDAGRADAPDAIERMSSRPDFVMLGYPVISFAPEVAGPNALGAYANSGRNLLGDAPSQAVLDDLSLEKRVNASTPPTFLFHTTNDGLVTVKNSIAFYSALVAAGVPAELHVFEKGAHGAGMGLRDPALSAWPTLLMNWLRQRGLLTAPSPSAPGRGATPVSADR